MPKSPDKLEQAYDHLDDTGIFDAATMREMTDFIDSTLGGQNEEFTAEAIAARSGNVALAGFLKDKASEKHDEWINSLHLGLPTSEFPVIPRKTPQERTANTTLRDELRDQVASEPKFQVRE